MDKTKFPAYGSVEVSKPTDSHGAVRRNPLHRDALVERPNAGIDTVTDILFYNARQHGTRNALGWRDIVDTIEEEKDVKKTVAGKEVTEKKTWKFFQLSEYRWLNFVEVRDCAVDMGKGLVELGLDKGQIFNIYAATA
jgi:long-chain acyl-CoA synthetase